VGNSPPPNEHAVLEAEQHVRHLNDEWVKAMVRRDGPTLDRIMAEDFLFTYPLEGDDKNQFIADVTSGDLRINHITREQVSVRIFGDTAVLSARDTAEWNYRGRQLKGQYKIIQVYCRRDKGWQLCVVQACPMD
jgi:ketosteroid isomerase-like protein